MSAEGKKKRGESGKSNAENAPFRLSGGGCWPDHLRRTMSALPGYAQRIGRPYAGGAFDKKIGGVSKR